MDIRAGIGAGGTHVVRVDDQVVMIRQTHKLCEAASDHARGCWQRCRCRLCLTVRQVHREKLANGRRFDKDPANDR